MPRPRKLTPAPTVDPNKLVAVLTRLELEQIDLTGAAQELGLTSEAFLEIVERDEGQLSAAVAEAVQQAKSDPTLAVEHSVIGLNLVSAALAKRAQDADNLSVGELSQIGGLLDKISALSEAKKLEAKADARPDAEWNEAHVCVIDDRPMPDGTRGFRLIILEPQHSALVGPDGALKRKHNPAETPEHRKAKTQDWLNAWFPLTPNGLIDIHRIAESMGGKRVRILNADGTWHD